MLSEQDDETFQEIINAPIRNFASGYHRRTHCTVNADRNQIASALVNGIAQISIARISEIVNFQFFLHLINEYTMQCGPWALINHDCEFC